MNFENEEMNSMNEMMNQIEESMKGFRAGDIVDGVVVSVSDSEAIVNIGYMADGIIKREELTEEKEVDLKDLLKSGDELKVFILKMNDGEGNVVLSKKKADEIKVWNDIEDVLKKGEAINVKVSEAVKGGVVAYIKGIRAFIPASQLSISYVKDLAAFVGKELKVKIIELDRHKRRVILSSREVEQEEKEVKKEQVWASLKKGEKRKGVVSRLTKFGAFVDLGGVDGLIHISELSWKRVKDPAEVVSIGDEVDVYVLDFDKDKGRISLALKEVNEDPWNDVIKEYKAGDIVEGKVVKLLDFGAFVEIKPGVEGLVHLSEISEERIQKPSEVLKIGDKVKVKILEIKEDKKISLSIKDASNDATESFSSYVDEDESVTLGDIFKDKLKDFEF